MARGERDAVRARVVLDRQAHLVEVRRGEHRLQVGDHRGGRQVGDVALRVPGPLPS
jgi:hypothetical protein